MIARNTIGSPSIDLRGGPHVPVGTGAPPFGTGSMGLLVGVGTGVQADQEKDSYGNEIDFLGDPVAGLMAVGFHVFTTGENTQPPQPALNMPGITFEVDPNLTLNATNFSSLVFQPTANSSAGQWSSYIDATLDSSGTWYLTGTAGTTTPGRGRRLPRQQRDLRFRGVRRAGRRPVENRARGGCERPPRAGLLSVPTPRYLGHGAVFGDRAGVGRGRGGRCRGRGS